MLKKESSLDRVLGRIDTLDTINLTNLAQRLARERALLETIFDTALEGIMVVDGQGIVHFANAASRKMAGIKEKDIGVVPLWRLVPGLRDSLGLSEGQPLESSVTSRELELTYPEKRYVRLYILPIEEEGDLQELESIRDRFVVIISDITREKLTNEEQIESEKVSSILLLAAGVAHELGNPLNSITIHLQLLERRLKKMKGKEAAKLQDSVEICRSEVDRLDGIIDNFLEAIRPREPDVQVIDLNEPLSDVLQFYANELSDREISVEVEVGSEPPVVAADRNQMKQAFFNVIKNAVEAMEPGGVLTVKNRFDDESVYLEFSDSGSGIGQEELPRVFEPFHTSKKTGTGLGLMIVQRIMRDHGGQIGIDSKEKVGTVVTLEFPKHSKKFRMLES